MVGAAKGEQGYDMSAPTQSFIDGFSVASAQLYDNR
jgi:hypothetical protein